MPHRQRGTRVVPIRHVRARVPYLLTGRASRALAVPPDPWAMFTPAQADALAAAGATVAGRSRPAGGQ